MSIPLVVVFGVESVISQQDVVDALEERNQPRDASFREQKVENTPTRLPKVELVCANPTKEERQKDSYPTFASHAIGLI